MVSVRPCARSVLHLFPCTKCSFQAAIIIPIFHHSIIPWDGSEAELIFTALAELSTRQIAESVEATGMPENAEAGRKGGGIAKRARRELEHKTGRRVVTGENFLPPRQDKHRQGMPPHRQ